MMDIRNRINRIGEELVKKDTFAYPDVVCKPEERIVPRGLIIEEDRRDADGCSAIVVGINPGKARPAECLSVDTTPSACGINEFRFLRVCCQTTSYASRSHAAEVA